MGSSKISSVILRPSFILLSLVLLGLAGSISGNPLPDSDTIDAAADQAKNFVDRAKNTFTGKAPPNHKNGLSHWEIAGIVAAAVILLLIIPCCICYCLCECVKELICCIFCCSWCRD